MSAFVWSDSYNIGDPTVDAQHSYLFALANELVESADQAALTDNAMKLFRYVREHFTYEESLMKRIGVPDEEQRAHIEMHDGLITLLSSISERIHRGDWSPAELDDFMNGWLLGHIARVDMGLSAYAKARV